MDWTVDCGGGAGRSTPQGSLFLNVGAKPTDPWTALDVAQAARPHLQLQNTIHWVKSIAIDKLPRRGAALDRDLAVGHYKPINSDRFVNDCHEFVFHFTPVDERRSTGRRSASPTRTRRTSRAGDRRGESALPRQYLVHPVPDDPEPRQGPAASGDLPSPAPGVLLQTARSAAAGAGDGPVPRPWLQRRRRR